MTTLCLSSPFFDLLDAGRDSSASTAPLSCFAATTTTAEASSTMAGSSTTPKTTTTTTATTTTATTTGDLVPLFSLPGLGGTVVTRLAFDVGGLLWTSCYNGTVHAYNVSSIDDDDDDDNDNLPRPPGAPIFSSDFTGEALISPYLISSPPAPSFVLHYDPLA